MLRGHSTASGMLPRSVEPGRIQPMQIPRFSAFVASLLLLCVGVALSVHARGASPPKNGTAEGPAGDQMIPKIEAIFAPLSDATSPGVAVLVRQGGRTVF